ncbi:phosphoesterase [Brevundimonas sp. LM2]|uniref:phosphatase PAP2 family protein n=1 Tax=Brevundimonas sp. LM2 TaxID=1938605 RepID=UPI000983A7CA|nr:phosphatase PAP2 family protein [Brevundimonas sp. LM2]AQR60352.1 phosphoesterase [Brevundimonas sp. LM2]
MPSSAPVRFFRRALRIARTEFIALSALLVIGLGVSIFADLAEDMREGDGHAFDQWVLTSLRQGGDPSDAWGPWWLSTAANDLTALGGISVLGLFATIAVIFLVIQRKRLSAVLLVLGLLGGVALSEGLKAKFERARPPEAFQAVETINASFPSGHALLSTVFYLSLAVMLARAFPSRRLKAYVIGAGVLIAVLVGLTRIYLGAHWATDVFAGWSVGAAWAMALWLVSYAVERRQIVHHATLVDEAEPARA